MEMEGSTPEMAKKLWHILRAVLFMIRKGISKNKVMLDLHLMFKRGNKLAGKAIGNLLTFHHHHSSSFGCRSGDALSFISPREYEFSCSNSPAVNFYPFYSNHNHRRHHHQNIHRFAKAYKYDDAATVAAVQKVLGILNNEVAVEASPMVALPGFGKSPAARQLRITDSPFPLKEEDGDSQQVDKAAEEFIKKFYKELKSQKSRAALESPYHGLWGR